MEVRDRIHGIHGVVADLITVPKKYEIAVETALGGSIQNIVTDSEQTAKQLIEYLKKNRYGRATFLPLTSIGSKNTFNQDKALKEPGVLGLANSLVETDGQYEGLIRYLLGRVVVVDTIDNAIALARKFQYSRRIVPLEGELLSAGGSMTGGAFKNTSNLLGRKREIEELEGACTKALTDVDRIEQDLVMNEALLAESREELESLKSRKQESYLRQNTVRMSISRTEDKKEEIRESYGDLERENSQLEEQIREIGRADEVIRLEEQNQDINSRLDSCHERLDAAKAEREEASRALSTVQLEASGLKQKDDFELENIRRVKEDVRRLEEELSGLSGGTDDSNLIIEEKLAEIAGLKAQIENTVIRAAGLESVIAEKTAEREEKSRQQKELFQKREELSDRMSSTRIYSVCRVRRRSWRNAWKIRQTTCGMSTS